MAIWTPEILPRISCRPRAMFTFDWAASFVATSLTIVEFNHCDLAKDELTALQMLENHVGFVIKMFEKRGSAAPASPVLAPADKNTRLPFNSPDNLFPQSLTLHSLLSTSDTSTAPAELPLTLSVEQWSVVFHNCKQNHQGLNRARQRLRFHHPFTGQLLKCKDKQHFTGADGAILCQQLAQHDVPPEHLTRIRNQDAEPRPRSRSPRPSGGY